MQLALIPPNSMRSSILDGTINLLLPWQMKELDPAFIRTAMETSYTILDNGAAEGRIASWNELTILAKEWNVQEVVLPDRLGDCEYSIEAARQAGKMEPTQELLAKGFKFMAVAQGQTLAEVMKCVYAYAGMDHIHVLGLPRILNWSFGETSRVKFCESFAKDELLRDLPIHCLGAYYPWPKEIKELAKLSNVRSMDTSLPWVYGLRGYHIDQPPKFALKTRPDDYFNQVVFTHQRAVVQSNVRQLLRWAKAPRS